MKAVTKNVRKAKFNHSGRTIRGRIERFLMRNSSPQMLQKEFDELSARDKLHFRAQLFPYILSKPIAGSDQDLNKLTDLQLEEMYQRAEQAAKKVAGW